jgi:hypothetical protein
MGGAKPMKRLLAALLVTLGLLVANPATAADSYDIKIVNASDINMVAKDSRLPIIIRNDYDSQARVLIHVSDRSGGPRFQHLHGKGPCKGGLEWRCRA